jgi:amidase
MVARWRSAGLTILGKTNTPEFAAEFVTEPSAYGPTRNPLFPGMTVGGSSGGAAAAVASGMVPIAHATDLGGSIRIPAACCGVYGFKPTAGLNSVGPHFSEIAGGLNSDHVVTRTVRDSAASLDITANRESVPSTYWADLASPTGKLRIGVSVRDPLGRLVGSDQQAAVRKASAVLTTLGHELVEYTYPEGLDTEWFDYLWISDIVMLVEERVSALRRRPKPDELEPLTWHLMDKARAGGDAAMRLAQIERARYTERYLGSMAGMDILLTPSLAENPPPDGALAFDSFADVDHWNEAGYRFAPFSIPANISGQPSASCPWFTGPLGQPVGVQLNAKPGRDLLLLQLSAQIEKLCLEVRSNWSPLQVVKSD